MKHPTIPLRFVALLVLLLSALPAMALAAPPSPPGLSVDSSIWNDVDMLTLTQAGEPEITTRQPRIVMANVRLLREALSRAPLEGPVKGAEGGILFPLPMPDGTIQRFRVVLSPIMAPELAARYPQITTYLGQGVDDPTATVRMDWTPQGFHAMILSASGTVYIDPFRRGNTRLYISYYKKDFVLGPQHRFVEPLVTEKPDVAPPAAPQAVKAASGSTLSSYRLAMAATGEYTQYHDDGNAANGGPVADALAAIVTAMNRVNGIYEREVAIRMNLIANTDDLIYTDPATDPYTNNDGIAMLGENQANIDTEIGSANYDIGHVFSTGGGGVANQGPCQNASKARGVTGLSNPIGDPFYVDYVAHEMGHQFSGSHTWNSDSCSGYPSQWVASAAYEPGSASTIMGYAGICGIDDLQPNSDDYFHTKSFDQIVAYSTTGSGSSCRTTSATGNNPPTVNTGSGGYTIPYDTPFVMSGTASDPDGDALTYNWEEFDLPTAAGPAPPNPGYVVPPYFRSFDATTSPSRTFPKLSDIVNNTTTIGEILPLGAANLTFRLTARDNRAGGGGVNYNTYSIVVSGAAGPFRVTAPNVAGTWDVGDSETVTWNVASTDAAPVSCPSVNIKLSTDGGYTYPITLVTGTSNDGSQSVTVPDNETTQARVKVECANNIFFDISNNNFTIQRSADLEMSKSDSPDPVAAGTQLTYNLTVTNNGPSPSSGFQVTDVLPAGVTFASASAGCSQTSPGTVTCTYGTLAASSSAAFTIVVDVDPGLVSSSGPLTITNNASVSGDDDDPDSSNNSATEDTTVRAEADLAIAKSDSPDPVIAGTNLTYELTVTNNGPSDSTGFQVTDALPAGVSFASGSASCAETAPGSGTVVCTHGALPLNDSVTFTIVVLVDADLVHNNGAPLTITNNATVTGDNDDPDPSNNSASADTLVIAVADLEIVSFDAVDPPAEILVGEDVVLTFRKVISNRGPSAPMDVRVKLTATPPPGATITPGDASILAPAVGLDELREIVESFTVRCLEPSHHLFTFSNEIAPDRPDDTDPDLSNNYAEITLDIECVVPVAVNIKPGSFPNSINLKSRGDIPLAVLTTLAGEYGLPIDFDATAIDPLSVRFGPRDLVWAETGGAFESHDRGHIEDSYELDEVTMDGDMDMVLHFLTQETSIQPGDVEACVKGAWTDSDGNVHKFFGCDSIRTVPPK